MPTFLTKQRAILKVYLINEIERSKSYGWAYKEIISTKNKEYQPTKSEVYKALHELTADGIIHRTKRLQEEGGKQEIVIYSFTENGYHEAQTYKQLVKKDLEHSKRLIDDILEDNY